METITRIPPHQWTHDGTKVLFLKCVNADGTSHGGFQWPRSGEVVAPDWDAKPECGGGLHGWPWGMAVGDGKEPDYSGLWLVFEADPAEVIDLGGKAKCRAANVVCAGTYLECNLRILKGQMAWAAQKSSGAASNSGSSGAASNSGSRGAASNSGDYGAASNSGYRGIAASTGEWSMVESVGSGLCCATADVVLWRIRTGAVLCQRTEKGAWLLFADEWKVDDGQIVLVEHGVIWKKW